MELINASFVFTDLVGQCIDSFLRSHCARFGEKSSSSERSGSLDFVGTALNRFGLSRNVGSRFWNGTNAVYGSRFEQKRKRRHKLRSRNKRRGPKNQGVMGERRAIR